MEKWIICGNDQDERRFSVLSCVQFWPTEGWIEELIVLLSVRPVTLIELAKMGSLQRTKYMPQSTAESAYILGIGKVSGVARMSNLHRWQ